MASVNVATLSLKGVAAAGIVALATGCRPAPPPPRVPVPAADDSAVIYQRDRMKPVGSVGVFEDPVRPTVAQVPPAQPARAQAVEVDVRLPIEPAAQASVTPPAQTTPTQPTAVQPTPVQPTPVQPAPVQPPAGQVPPGEPPVVTQAPAGRPYLPPVVTAPTPTTPTGAYDDPPIVRDRPPEQAKYVEAYNRIGRPTVAIYVNRSLEGRILPVNENEPVVTAQATRVSGNPATQETQRVDVYLQRGQYDEAYARSLDYEAIENVLTDWLAANGQVSVISPTLARAKLTAEQQQRLEAGEPRVLLELTERLDADVLIQVQAKPTRQTYRGLEIRIVGEAMNTRGGRSLARAVVDVPPPLEKTQINDYTRFLARKMMDDLADTWTIMALAREQAGDDNK